MEKKIAQEIKDELREKVLALQEEGISVSLAVIQVGNDPASSVYVNNKKKACAYIGIRSVSYELAEETTEEELLSLIDKLNRDASINGILVQLPLPSQIREEQIIRAIDPNKDVDGFHPENVGRLVTGGEGLCFLYAGGDHSAAEAFRRRDRAARTVLLSAGAILSASRWRF